MKHCWGMALQLIIVAAIMMMMMISSTVLASTTCLTSATYDPVSSSNNAVINPLPTASGQQITSGNNLIFYHLYAYQ
jgi:hypothetical protein